MAAAVTIALLGAVGLSSLFGGAPSSSRTSETSSTSAAAATTSSKPATSTSSPPPTVRLDPAWPSKGTSHYSEAESTAPATTAPR